MRELRLTQAHACAKPFMVLACSILFTLLTSITTIAQCDPVDGSVAGTAFIDSESDGTMSASETRVSNVMVTAYDKDGISLGFAMTDDSGHYTITNLPEGDQVSLQFSFAGDYTPGILGPDNGSTVQYTSVPSCNNNIGLLNLSNSCGTNPEILLTCFAQGDYDGSNKDLETIIGIEHNFDNSSATKVYANNYETGSIWGLAYKNTTNDIFSSAFVKQYAGLKDGPGAIYRTTKNGSVYETTLFADLSELGVDVADLVSTDVYDCAYGAQAGKFGLGALVLSPDEQWLYTINLSDNTLVKLSSTNPRAETTTITPIPDPGCSNGDNRGFALVFRGNDLYVGTTCTAETSYLNGVLPSDLEEESAANVYKYTPETDNWTLEFTTNYIKGYWRDDFENSYKTIHWLTDLDFTDEGNMLISLSDRVGHRFCSNDARIDGQNPDLLVVYKNIDGDWQLESNGSIEIPSSNGNIKIEGTGVGNGEGPDGGEFFAYDHWITNPSYHNETALGSIVVLPGSGSVVAMVYDPLVSSYSGGMHRYNTLDGTKISAKQLYERDFTANLGKATGFGEVVVKCGESPIEIGNYVWFDNNNNGTQDADENGFSGVNLELLDENCEVIATTTTDLRGYYSFNITNVDRDQDGVADGLQPNSQYYIKLAQAVETSGAYYIIDGEQYFVCAGGANTSNQTNCDVSIVDGICGNQPVAQVTTGALGSNDHTFDIGLYTPTILDLALKKELLSNAAVTFGSLVDFKITVVNQGEKLAKGVTVTDYLNDAYSFSASDNPGWNLSGEKIEYVYTGDIAPGAEQIFYLRLQVEDFAMASELLNYAEISGASDNSGPVLSDIDSSFDNIGDNDTGGEFNTDTDDEIDDSGTSDEDDHDVAGPNMFDLALKIEDKETDKIYRAGDRVDFIISVYNQGLVDAETFTVVNYIPEGLQFLEADRNDWTVNGSQMTFTDTDGIVAGTKKTYCISFLIRENVGSVDQIVNNAEIAGATVEGGQQATDFDSTPDMIMDNDNGGDVLTPSDNLLSDHGDSDEDDADPVVIRLRYTDLALRKTEISEIATPGELVSFKIEVINQGTETIGSFEVVDYFPSVLTLEDENWTLGGDDRAFITVEPENGLAQGKSYPLLITFRVKDNNDKYPFVNYAEIFKVYDTDGLDISNFDIDSTPDAIKDNDNGGEVNGLSDNNINLPQNIDEDDQDPAMMQFISAEFVDQCLCISPSTGRFGNIIEITAPVGQTWYIDQTIGLNNFMFDSNGLTIMPYESGIDGHILPEFQVSSSESIYQFPSVSEDGQAFQITFRNENDDVVTLEGGPCNNGVINVNGSFSLCEGATETYTVTNPTAGANYVFTLPTGGAIVSTTATTATIEWENVTGGPHELVVANASNSIDCQAPTLVGGVGVTIGQADGPMSCIGDVNISLNQNCELLVRPQTIAAGPLDPLAPYSVMLTMPDGTIIPNNLLNEEHIGIEITAKLIEGCGGNSCWATITVEDKLPPVLYCEDTEIVCYNYDNYQGPIAIDACEGNVEAYQVGAEQIFVYDCHPEFVRKVTRQYQAEDSKGNVSDMCTIDIFVKKINIDDIVYPEDIIGDDAFACDEVELNADGYPTLESTGVPTINGTPLIPGITPLCNIAMDYNDRTVGPIGCTTKVMREFRLVYNTCQFIDNGSTIDSIPSTQIFKYTQTIELEDNNPPVFTQMDDITVSAGSGDCEASVFLPEPVVTDACATDIEIDIKYPGGFADNQSSSFVLLPAGTNEVTYYAYDECGNLDSMKIDVTVMDMTAPVVVCDVPTALGINSDGIGYAYASSFDDGSTDACGIDYMQVRRLDNGASCGPESTTFGDFVVFCCEDVGNEVMVELLVVDFAGNENSCMVFVEIQDKFPPAISCPADVTVDCATPFDLDDLSVYGEAVATDACMVMIEEDASYAPTNACGEGVITRTFVASDNNGSAICTQTITLVNDAPFDMAGIIFPPEYETEVCAAEALEPNQLPFPFDAPQINDDACDMVSFTHSDEIFDFSGDNACYKIYRTWTVINWCVMVDGTPETFTGYQVIKVNNSVAPDIIGEYDPIMVCSFDDNCENGQVTLSASATDDCTLRDNLRWSYFITLESGETLADNGAGNIIELTTDFSIGNHNIIYTFEDRCGNVTSQLQEFSIQNCTPPNAVCIDGLAVELVPMDTDNDGIVDAEMACLFAEQLNASSVHTCDLPLVFSFSADTSDTKRLYDCANLGDNEVTLWVTDSNGNTDICVSTLNVQDNNDIDLCPSIEDCVTFPENTTVTTCNADLAPEILGLLPVIDLSCAMCDDFDITFNDILLTYPNADCNYIERNFTVTFNCFNSPMIVEGTQIISLLNAIAPTITCPADGMAVASDGSGLSCEAFVSLEPATFISNCNTDVVITNDSEFADASGADASGIYPVGTTVVEFTATDACNNTNTCTINVVVTDEMGPTCNLQDVTVSVVSGGSVQIDFDDIDNGSTDACGGAVTAVSISPNTFTCADIGSVNFVTVIIQDESGNQTTCTDNVEVTVVDVEAPICNTQNITVSIEQGTTSVSINPSDVDDGSTDACGTASLVSVSPDTFDCTTLGDNEVILTVTDQSGNTSTCTATVTVEENVAPECNAGSQTIEIDENGIATVDAEALGAGSTDACGMIVSYEVDPATFTCEDLGSNEVTLTVTDAFGNSSSCLGTVIVEENDAPLCVTQDITVNILEGETSVTIEPEDVDDGSSDGCGIATLVSVVPNTFTCEDLGDNEVVLTVTDQDDNTSTCTAIVTVGDLVPPTCNAGTLTLSIDDTGAVTITAEEIDNGSTDECGEIVAYSVSPDTFDCTDAGDNTVILTVTDNNGNSSTCEGTVTVEDKVAPICNTQDITVSLDENGAVLINATQVNDGSVDGCTGLSSDLQSLAVSPFSFNCEDIGENIVVLNVIDMNGNSSTCEATVTIEDTTAPMCTLQDITVSLTDDQGVTVTGEQFDNGSVDECGGPLDFEVTPNMFDCDDFGDDNPVVVTVTDQFGNATTCTANVVVEDNIEIQCITQDITVSLDESGFVLITPEMIDNGSTAGCDQPVTLSLDRDDFNCNDASFGAITVTLTVFVDATGESSECTATVTVIDDIVPTITCMDDVTVECEDFTGDLDTYGNVDNIVVNDNCAAGLETVELAVIEDINVCGVGTYTRTFQVTDLAGNSASCTQVVTVELGDNPLIEDDLTFPPDTLIFGDCSSFDPDNLDTSVTIDSTAADCFNVSISFLDTGINPDSPCNDTITRTYTVLDSCQIGTGAGEFTFVQTIIINDTTAPIVTGPADLTVTVQDTMTCTIDLDLSGFTVDNCDENFTVTNNSPFADNPDSGDASGAYPVGEYEITLTATDDCDNSSDYVYNVTVLDTTYVYITCFKLQKQMEADLSVTIEAFEMIDTFNIFNCLGTPVDTVVSYSDTDINDTIGEYGCEYVPQPLGERVYVYLDGILVDSCRGSIQLFDPMGFCDDSFVGSVVGSVLTADNEPVPGVHINLDGSNASIMTDENGLYAFPAMEGGAAYEVIPTKDDDPTNGVTTLDLILIQRHILGLSELGNPYDLIAADIDASGNLSGIDIIQLRKLILGIYDDFPANTSWRMVDREFSFWDPSNAQEEDFPETYDIDALVSTMKADFIGVKTGDVNGSVSPGLLGNSEVETRSDNPWYLEVTDRKVTAGQSIEIEMKVTDAMTMQGFQMSLDTDNVRDFELTSSVMSIRNDNYTIDKNGTVNVSWTTTDVASISKGTTVMTLIITPIVDSNLSDMISISTEGLNAETYVDNNIAHNRAEIIWNTKKSEFSLFQNTPNPWTETTDISFMIPQNGKVTINVRSINGQKVKSFNGYYDAGVHSVKLTNDDLIESGVYYYEMRYDNQIVVEKMILLR